MITVGIATLKEREDSFRRAIESTYDQVDIIFAVLNFYDHAPDWLIAMPKVKWITAFNILGASGKFLTTFNAEGYYLALDDDLIVPEGYVSV